MKKFFNIIGFLLFGFLTAQEPKGTIGYTSTQDGNFEIYTMNADGSNSIKISNHPKLDYGNCWSPNGETIYFYSNRDGNDEIYSMNSDGNNPINLTSNPSNDRIPEIAPNGKFLAFQSDRDNPNGEIYLMNLENKTTIRLTDNKEYEESACFSKNSKKILFSREFLELKDSIKESNSEIFMLDIKSKKETRLTYKRGFDSGAKFSPDNKKIAFYGRDEITGNYDIFIMNSDGSEIENLTNDTLQDFSPCWSPDGKWLAFTRGNSENYDIWIINIQTKELRRLTTQPKRDETPFWKE